MAFITVLGIMPTQIPLVIERAQYPRIALLAAIYLIDFPDKEEEVDQWHNKPQTLLKKTRFPLLVLNQGKADR